MIQQELGAAGFGSDLVPKEAVTKERTRCKHEKTGNQSPWGYYIWRTRKWDPSLNYLYEIIMGWPSLPLLFNRGAGKLKTNGRGAGDSKKRTKPQKPRKKRRKFGDEEDSEDEAYIPKVGLCDVKFVQIDSNNL